MAKDHKAKEDAQLPMVWIRGRAEKQLPKKESCVEPLTAQNERRHARDGTTKGVAQRLLSILDIKFN